MSDIEKLLEELEGDPEDPIQAIIDSGVPISPEWVQRASADGTLEGSLLWPEYSRRCDVWMQAIARLLPLARSRRNLWVAEIDQGPMGLLEIPPVPRTFNPIDLPLPKDFGIVVSVEIAAFAARSLEEAGMPVEPSEFLDDQAWSPGPHGAS